MKKNSLKILIVLVGVPFIAVYVFAAIGSRESHLESLTELFTRSEYVSFLEISQKLERCGTIEGGWLYKAAPMRSLKWKGRPTSEIFLLTESNIRPELEYFAFLSSMPTESEKYNEVTAAIIDCKILDEETVRLFSVVQFRGGWTDEAPAIFSVRTLTVEERASIDHKLVDQVILFDGSADSLLTLDKSLLGVDLADGAGGSVYIKGAVDSAIVQPQTGGEIWQTAVDAGQLVNLLFNNCRNNCVTSH